jgi:hypothetical protein
MATLKEKIVALMPGNPERDEAVEKELDNIRAADKVAGTLYQRMEKVQHARSAKIRELDAASLTYRCPQSVPRRQCCPPGLVCPM